MQRPLLAISVCALQACSFQMQAKAGASSGGGGSAVVPPSVPASPAPASEAHQGDSKHSGKGVSLSFHKSGSISGKIDWQGRSGRLCRAAAPFKFVGLAKFNGSAQLTPSGLKASGTGQASGKSSAGVAPSDCEAPRTPVPAPRPPVAIQPRPEPEPEAKPETLAKADAHSIPTTKPNAQPTKTDKVPWTKPKPAAKPPEPPAAKPPEPPAPKPPEPKPPEAAPPSGPTPEQLETPKSPPAEPPKNVFGYDEPVLGCFEGQVFPLAPSTKKLPESYEALTPVSVVYACEWDIAPRAWDQGFPGVANRFEWFAIRYAGAFRIAEAGQYAFRVSSDDGVKVLIDGKEVVNNDGVHPPREARGKVQLEKGDHHMVLEYFQGPRFEINLQLWVTPPGKPEELFTVR